MWFSWTKQEHSKRWEITLILSKSAVNFMLHCYMVEIFNYEIFKKSFYIIKVKSKLIKYYVY